MYASETWTQNEAEGIKFQAMEMRCPRGACGLNRMDGESNENVFRKFSVYYD